VLPETAYQKGDRKLGPGDLLVLFSDGVVEAANSKGVEFGQERIENSRLAGFDLRLRTLDVDQD